MPEIKDESNNNTITTKARYWTAVCYPENMKSDWQEEIGKITQLPGVYCVHDKDLTRDGEERKAHVHIMLAFPNTTTYKSALSIFKSLSVSPDQPCCNTCEKVNNVRFMYNYLIHDTEDCRKKHKHLYTSGERIAFNAFDIGAYEQLGVEDKKAMRKELSQLIYEQGFMNYLDFYEYVVTNYDSDYEDVVISYSGHFERMTKGNFQKWRFAQMNTDER